MANNKIRLDLYLFEKGFALSRSHAGALIMAGNVYINNQKALKSGTFINDNDIVEVKNSSEQFVSRGGHKLMKALTEFSVKLNNKICMDIGASTGGFTDCMLQKGAKKVYSVDVGYGQLAWKLRNDPRVVNFERTNIRYIDKNLIVDKFDFASIDVSFISLKLIFPVLFDLLNDNSKVICLIKPQFEAGKEKVGKKGVVRDPETHIEVISNVFNYAKNNNFSVLNLTFSPIKGPQGNIEYLVLLKKDTSIENCIDTKIIELTVAAAHQTLSERVN